jgi:hypothetical protein
MVSKKQTQTHGLVHHLFEGGWIGWRNGDIEFVPLMLVTGIRTRRWRVPHSHERPGVLSEGADHADRGADDNASGVSGVMELARRFAANPAPRTVRFVAFGTEEPPNIRTKHMGSFHYARLCRERNDDVVAMMSVEMIGTFSDAPDTQRSPPLMSGYPTVGNFLLFVGDTSVGPLVRHSRELFTRHDGMPAEVMVGPRFMPGVNSSDQWSFWQWNYPNDHWSDEYTTGCRRR